MRVLQECVYHCAWVLANSRSGSCSGNRAWMYDSFFVSPGRIDIAMVGRATVWMSCRNPRHPSINMRIGHWSNTKHHNRPSIKTERKGNSTLFVKKICCSWTTINRRQRKIRISGMFWSNITKIGYVHSDKWMVMWGQPWKSKADRTAVKL